MGNICEDLVDKHHIWDLHLPDRWESRGITTIYSFTIHYRLLIHSEATENDLCLIQCVCTPFFTFELSLKLSCCGSLEPGRLQVMSGSPFSEKHNFFLLHGQKKAMPRLECYFVNLLYVKHLLKVRGGRFKLSVKATSWTASDWLRVCPVFSTQNMKELPSVKCAQNVFSCITNL